MTDKLNDEEIQEENTSNISSVFPFVLDETEIFAYWNNVFTPEECERIIEYGNTKNLKDAIIYKNDNSPLVDESLRKAKTTFLYPYPDKDMIFVFERIREIVKVLNERFFNFDIYGFAEGLQFGRYDEGSFHAKHIDKTNAAIIRKLSVSIQLTDPEEYEGGDLSVFIDSNATRVGREQGKLILFPSYIVHEVSPITEGTRHSLVGWITGPNFK